MKLESEANKIIQKMVDALRGGRLPKLTDREKARWNIYAQVLFQQVPDRLDPLDAGADVHLDKVLADGDWTLTPTARKSVLRAGRLQGTARIDPDVNQFLFETGHLFALVVDPTASFVIGSNPLVPIPAPGLTKLGRPEWWLPIASDVAISPGGKGQVERVVRITGPSPVQQLNAATFAQSNIVAGRSDELLRSVVYLGAI